MKSYQQQFSELLCTITHHKDLNFYGHVMVNLHPSLNTEIETARVRYLDGRFFMEVNPHFMFETLKTIEDRMYLIIHECLHVLFMHFENPEGRDPELWNIAQDLTINQLIFKNLPADSVLKSIGCDIGPNFPFPLNLTSHMYYELLAKDSEKHKGQCKIQDIGESDKIDSIAKEVMKQQVQAIANNAKARSSSGSDLINSIIDFLNAAPQVDWQSELRDITGNKKIFKTSTIKKRNRRFRDNPEVPGKKKSIGFTVACVVDVSGSMGNDDIVQGLVEIKSICELTQSNMWLVQCDTKASEPELFDAQELKFTRKSSGGTYLYPGVEALYEAEIDFDALVIITDGEIEKNWPEIVDVPVFFLTTTGHLYFDVSVSSNYRQFDLAKSVDR